MSTTTPSVIIIGAGFGGLGMAMELRTKGFDNFTILERASEAGGVPCGRHDMRRRRVRNLVLDTGNQRSGSAAGCCGIGTTGQ